MPKILPATDFIKKEETQNIRSICYSNDGKYIASGGKDNIVRIYNAKTGVFIAKTPALGGVVFSLNFSNNNKYLAVGTADHKVRIYEIKKSDGSNKTKDELQDTLNNQPVADTPALGGAVFSLSFSSDNKYLAVGTEDGGVRIYDISGGNLAEALKNPIAQMLSSDFGGGVKSLSFNSDNRYLAVRTTDHKVRIYEIKKSDGSDKTKAELQNALNNPIAETPIFNVGEEVPISVSFSGDSRYLAVGTYHKVRIYDISGDVKKTFKNPPIAETPSLGGAVHSLGFSPDGSGFAFSAGKELHIYYKEIKVIAGETEKAKEKSELSDAELLIEEIKQLFSDPDIQRALLELLKELGFEFEETIPVSDEYLRALWMTLTIKQKEYVKEYIVFVAQERERMQKVQGTQIRLGGQKKPEPEKTREEPVTQKTQITQITTGTLVYDPEKPEDWKQIPDVTINKEKDVKVDTDGTIYALEEGQDKSPQIIRISPNGVPELLTTTLSNSVVRVTNNHIFTVANPVKEPDGQPLDAFIYVFKKSAVPLTDAFEHSIGLKGIIGQDEKITGLEVKEEAGQYVIFVSIEDNRNRAFICRINCDKKSEVPELIQRKKIDSIKEHNSISIEDIRFDNNGNLIAVGRRCLFILNPDDLSVLAGLALGYQGFSVDVDENGYIYVLGNFRIDTYNGIRVYRQVLDGEKISIEFVKDLVLPEDGRGEIDRLTLCINKKGNLVVTDSRGRIWQAGPVTQAFRSPLGQASSARTDKDKAQISADAKLGAYFGDEIPEVIDPQIEKIFTDPSCKDFRFVRGRSDEGNVGNLNLEEGYGEMILKAVQDLEREINDFKGYSIAVLRGVDFSGHYGRNRKRIYIPLEILEIVQSATEATADTSSRKLLVDFIKHEYLESTGMSHAEAMAECDGNINSAALKLYREYAITKLISEVGLYTDTEALKQKLGDILARLQSGMPIQESDVSARDLLLLISKTHRFDLAPKVIRVVDLLVDKSYGGNRGLAVMKLQEELLKAIAKENGTAPIFRLAAENGINRDVTGIILNLIKQGLALYMVDPNLMDDEYYRLIRTFSAIMGNTISEEEIIKILAQGKKNGSARTSSSEKMSPVLDRWLSALGICLKLKGMEDVSIKKADDDLDGKIYKAGEMVLTEGDADIEFIDSVDFTDGVRIQKDSAAYFSSAGSIMQDIDSLVLPQTKGESTKGSVVVGYTDMVMDFSNLSVIVDEAGRITEVEFSEKTQLKHLLERCGEKDRLGLLVSSEKELATSRSDIKVSEKEVMDLLIKKMGLDGKVLLMDKSDKKEEIAEQFKESSVVFLERSGYTPTDAEKQLIGKGELKIFGIEDGACFHAAVLFGFLYSRVNVFSDGNLTKDGEKLLRELPLFGFRGDIDDFIKSVKDSLYFSIKIVRLEESMKSLQFIRLAVDVSA